jgi:hypothetical protein
LAAAGQGNGIVEGARPISHDARMGQRRRRDDRKPCRASGGCRSPKVTSSGKPLASISALWCFDRESACWPAARACHGAKGPGSSRPSLIADRRRSQITLEVGLGTDRRQCRSRSAVHCLHAAPMAEARNWPRPPTEQRRLP